jgi:hypothetical protein
MGDESYQHRQWKLRRQDMMQVWMSKKNTQSSPSRRVQDFMN